jgi:hypothetical protein
MESVIETYDGVLSQAKTLGIKMDGMPKSYEQLYKAAKEVREKQVSGLICEIGIRMGFGLFSMMCGAGNKPTYIGVDPYGQIVMMQHGHNTDYTNSMKNDFLKNIYAHCFETGINFSFYWLEDTEFFTRYADGVPVYEWDKKMETTYSLVHVDGPHDGEHVWAATRFFEPRLSVGGFISYDNIELYDHHTIEQYLAEHYIVLRDRSPDPLPCNQKAIYQKRL